MSSALASKPRTMIFMPAHPSSAEQHQLKFHVRSPGLCSNKMDHGTTHVCHIPYDVLPCLTLAFFARKQNVWFGARMEICCGSELERLSAMSTWCKRGV